MCDNLAKAENDVSWRDDMNSRLIKIRPLEESTAIIPLHSRNQHNLSPTVTFHHHRSRLACVLRLLYRFLLATEREENRVTKTTSRTRKEQ